MQTLVFMADRQVGNREYRWEQRVHIILRVEPHSWVASAIGHYLVKDPHRSMAGEQASHRSFGSDYILQT